MYLLLGGVCQTTQSLPVPPSLCITGNHSLFTVCRKQGAFSLPESDRGSILKETQRGAFPVTSSDHFLLFPPPPCH